MRFNTRCYVKCFTNIVLLVTVVQYIHKAIVKLFVGEHYHKTFLAITMPRLGTLLATRQSLLREGHRTKASIALGPVRVLIPLMSLRYGNSQSTRD